MSKDDVAQAQKLYRILISGQKPEMTPALVRMISTRLKDAKQDYSALDPSGTRGHDEVLREVQTISDSYHITEARRFLKILDKGGKIDLPPERVRGMIDDELKQGNAGYAALDPKGQKTEKEMREVVDQSERNAHLRSARIGYEKLWESFVRVLPESAQRLKDTLYARTRGSDVSDVRKHLSQANQPLSALYTHEGHSDAEVDATLRQFAQHQMPLTLAALEHRAGWQNISKVSDALQSQGVKLDKASLMQPFDAEGTTFLERAANSRMLGFAISHLNRNGERLGTADLLDNGKPNRLLTTILSADIGAKLMLDSNWLGQKPAELRQLYNAIPDEQREQLEGYHGLAARMGQHMQQHEQGR